MTDESIFAAALAIPSSSERAAYLDRACAGQPTLRREVEVEGQEPFSCDENGS